MCGSDDQRECVTWILSFAHDEDVHEACSRSWMTQVSHMVVDDMWWGLTRLPCQFCLYECSTSCRELPRDDFSEDGARLLNGTTWALGGADAFMFVFCIQSLWKTGDRLPIEWALGDVSDLVDPSRHAPFCSLYPLYVRLCDDVYISYVSVYDYRGTFI